MKRVHFGPKPTATGPASADSWVSDRPAAEPIKRLTVDLPVSLHQKVKVRCAILGQAMADVIRDYLERQFAVDEAAPRPTDGPDPR